MKTAIKPNQISVMMVMLNDAYDLLSDTQVYPFDVEDQAHLQSKIEKWKREFGRMEESFGPVTYSQANKLKAQCET